MERETSQKRMIPRKSEDPGQNPGLEQGLYLESLESSKIEANIVAERKSLATAVIA